MTSIEADQLRERLVALYSQSQFRALALGYIYLVSGLTTFPDNDLADTDSGIRRSVDYAEQHVEATGGRQ
jgi:hypothetical protein